MNFKKIIFIGLLTSKFAFGSDESNANEKTPSFPSNELFRGALMKFNSCMKRVAENVAKVCVEPTVVEIMEFYKKNCRCPEDIEPLIFQQYIESEFKNRVVGQELSVILQYYQQDQQGIVSDFGVQLHKAGFVQAKKLQDHILSLNIPPFSLSNLRVYEPLVKKTKKDFPEISFNDQLLCFASHLFHAIPWGQRQYFSTDELKQSAIEQIYKEFNNFFEQGFKFDNDMQKIEKFNRFLTVIQYLLDQNQLQHLYIVERTKNHIDFKANSKTVETTMREIICVCQALELQPKLKLWQAQCLEQAVVRATKERDLQEFFDHKASVWQQGYQEMNKEWDIHYKDAVNVLESETLHFEIQMQKYQEFLEKLKKMKTESDKKYKELLDVEQKNHSKLLTNYKDEYLRCQQKNEERKLGNIGCAAYQTLQDCKRLLQEYEKKMQVCEQEFIAKLNEDQALANVCEQNRAIFTTIENNRKIRIQNALKLEQKDLLWTNIYEDGEQLIAELEALGFGKIVQDEKYEKVVAKIQEKNRVSLGVVQRFMQLMLQQRRTAREEIKEIKVKKIVEELQNLQSRSDLESLRPAHLVGTAVPEFHEVVVPQPEQRAVSNIRQNNPYSVSLVPSSDDEQFLSDQRSFDSVESVEEQVDSGWFACADGFPLYDRGNGWAQDEQGYWYAYNSITNFWDVYENPLPPTYEQITERKVTRLLQ
jgi:hypothetical protein